MTNSRSKYAVLGLLTLGPMSGYDLKKVAEQSIAHFWSESYGQIYPTLKQLVTEKLATVREESGNGARARQVYSITAKGRHELAEWLADRPHQDPPRMELLLKLFFARQGEAATAARHVAEYLAAQRSTHQRYAEIRRSLGKHHRDNPDLPYWLLTLRFGELMTEAHIRWAEEAQDFLDKPSAARARSK
jgi:DNA-binding PadR family transcriptional regulator